MKKSILAFTLAGAMVLSASPFASPIAEAVGNGPNYGGNETINTSILHTYDEMVDNLKEAGSKTKGYGT